MKNKERIKGKKVGVSFATVFTIATVIMLIIMTVPKPVLEDDWKIVWIGNLASAEGDPGAGGSGFLEIFYINHTATPGTAYDENDSSVLEGWCTAGYGYATADEFKLEIDYTKTFDILGRFRWNKTHAWNGTAFIGADCRVKITHTGLNGNPIANVTGTLVITRNVSTEDYIWGNVYWNNGGAGYTIAKNSPYTDNKCTQLCQEARF
jgi:hypothetical protein